MVDIRTTAPWRRTGVFPEYRDRSLREVFRDLAAACGNRTAVRDGSRSLDYRELSESIDAVAGAVQERHADATHGPAGEPWTVTAVLGHGIDALLIAYGVMAAGAVLVPIDAADPGERIALLHREGGASLAVGTGTHAALARAATGAPTLLLEDALARARPPDADPGAAAPALVNFTSGSTGTPKGVVRDHATLVRAAFTTASSNFIEADDIVAFIGSFSFIGAYGRSLGALVAGAELCIQDHRAGDSRELAAWILDRRISVLQFIPSVLRNFTDAVSRAGLPPMATVKIVSLGGEATYGRDVARARPLFGPLTSFVNRYGSSETSVLGEWVTTPEDDARTDTPLPLGRALPWAEISVVDDTGRPVGAGDVGMPDVVSEHCALGYWNDPELTAARFWALPDGRRGFHMSDHVRVRDDGVLEYVARADDRLKVRGAMVSPSEVERAMTTLEGVRHAAVVAAPARDGGTRLVGYVVPDAGAELSAWEVRRELAGSVPTAMVPGTIVLLAELPLTPRGKVDRRALPPPPDAGPRPSREPTGREAVLANLIGDVLAVDRVGLDDDFFDLGGDSLAAVELMAAIDEQFGVDLPPSVLLEAPTTAALAPLLNHRRPRASSTVVLLRPGSRGTPLFVVAGGGSPATSLRALAHALPSGRPVFGIQARGLEERALPDRSVEASARRYLTDLRAVQPSGPYLLAGHSFGGLVAFEMACRLERAGETVALLVVIDTTAPGTSTATSGEDTLATRWQEVRAEPSVTHRMSRVARAVSGRARARHELLAAGLLVRRLRQYRVFTLLAVRMAQRYRPRSTFCGSFVLARASLDPGADGLRPRFAAWDDHVDGPHTDIEIADTHTGIMRRPRVVHLADALAPLLAEADRAFPVAGSAERAP
jgi:acyl-coenzyme A synthetase/AMP-(fatty) acid ligase/thioesterase domain-containing protein/acyl carrier protein